VSFRARLTLVSATAVAVAVVLVAVASYVAVRGTLRGELDDGLRQQARAGQDIFRRAGGLAPRPPATLPLPAPAPGRERAYLQVIGAGTVTRTLGSSVRLPVSARGRRVARGSAGAFFEDRDVKGSPLRIYTVPAGRGRALQLARPLGEINTALARLRLVLAALCLVGVALAVALGRFLSLEAAQSALDASLLAQRQLVADASHELRTPVASLRTNVEVLRGADALPREERERLHDDVDEQISELGALVNDVIELARGDEPPSRPEEVRLDLLVLQSAERMRRLVPERVIVLEAEPTLVSGVPERLARAVNNVLDNAVKWGPPGTPVDVTVRAGEVAVRDHGRGIPADELPHVFDRFYRGTGARDRPGSGLGLAIVRQVAVSHGGSVTAEAAPGGGTTVRVALPPRALGTAPVLARPS
jgi:two-component system sensor histidine kinase MprB